MGRIKLEGPEDKVKDKYNNKKLELKNIETKPFKGWSDWHTENGEAIITFITMDRILYTEWQNQTQHSNFAAGSIGTYATLKTSEMELPRPVKQDESVTIYDHSEFENNFKGPGIYLEDTHYNDEDKMDEVYKIIVPQDFMTRKLCETHLQALNNKYNRSFHFEDTDFEKRRYQDAVSNIQKNEDIPDGIKEEHLHQIVEETAKWV